LWHCSHEHYCTESTAALACFQNIFYYVVQTSDAAHCSLRQLSTAGRVGITMAARQSAFARLPRSGEPVMTLIAFAPERIETLAWRMFDLAAEMRRNAEKCRQNQLEAVELHGQKLEGWLEQLEAWMRDSQARLDSALLKRRGAQRARALLSAEPEQGSRKRRPRRKKRK
jgi:hypothetical protein